VVEPAAAPDPAPTAAPPERARSWVLLDFKHDLRDGGLKLWIDGVLTFERRLRAPVTKKIVAFTFRDDRLAQAVEVPAGRHDVKVQVGWEGERRFKTATVDLLPDKTRVLEIRLSGHSRELTLDWK
jgi:hypothetical protein